MSDYTPDELQRLREWSDVLDESSYYEVLGVLEIADDEAIRDAFRSLARAFHPDVHRSADNEVRRAVGRLFERAAEAYRVLTDPELRTRYDIGLARGELRLSTHDLSRRAQRPDDTRPLHELCRSAGAKLTAQRADKLLTAGDLAAAKRELERALELDGGANLDLEARLRDIDVALYAMGQ